MKKTGLTGGIGAGKSVVAQVFSILGIPVFNADTEAKKAYSDTVINEKVKQHFGEDIFKDNNLDTKKLAGIVFSDKEKLKILNGLIHPFVFRNFDGWCNNHKDCNYVIMESAVLFESGYQALFDKIITVSAPLEVCISRIIKRDNVSRDDAVKRINNQLPDEKKAALSDFVIINDDQALIIPQIIDIHNTLSIN